MARRPAGHGGGLHRLAEAMVGARRDGPEDGAGPEGISGRRSQNLQDRAEGEVRGGDRVAGQALGGRALHDAQAHRRDRSVQADRGIYRLRSFRVQEGRVEARRETRLHQVRQVQAARRADIGPVRRQGGERRSGRVDFDARRRDPGQRAAERRARLSRKRLRRPSAAGREGQGRPRHQGTRLQPVCLPSELAVAALQQREGPPGRRAGPQPGGLPAGQYRRQALLSDVQGDVHLRLAAGDRRRHGRAGRGQCRKGKGASGRGRI